MAKLTTKDQRIATGVTYPRSAYSRVIACRCLPNPDMGWHWAVTPAVGGEFWLLSVRVWTSWKPADGLSMANFKIYYGKGKPTGTSDIEQWNRLDPVWGKDEIHTYKFYNRDHDFAWTMAQHFTGIGWRFGLLGKVEGAVDGRVIAAFEISEG